MSVTLDSKPKKKNRSWKTDVLPIIKKELIEFHKAGFKPTLRTIFYILISRKILENVQSDYTYLSGYTAKCRKRYVILKRANIENLRGKVMTDEHFKRLSEYNLLKVYKKSRYSSYDNPIIAYRDLGNYFEEKLKKYVIDMNEVLVVDCFSDETRGIIDDFIDEYKTPEEYIIEKLDFLDELPSGYKKLIPKWHNQEYHIELWTEKNAMVGTFGSILEGLDVRIVYNRGFDSMGHSWETYQRMKKAWKQAKKVRILYCGDLDPSGDAMDDIIKENMNVCFDVEEYKRRGLYDFTRIGVLYEHIDKFKLPKITDPKVIKKLLGDSEKKGDPRTKRFIEKYHELFQVEIDAMVAFARDELKDMIWNHIKIYYDQLIYRNLLSDKKHSEGQISIHVMKNVRKFLEEFNIKSFMESTF